jgi:hypothetical protein
MVDTDLSLWGIWAMPTGIAICFGAALLHWLKMEIAAAPEGKPVEKKKTK